MSASASRQPYVQNSLSPWPRIRFSEAASETEPSVNSAAPVHTALSSEPESCADDPADILQRPFISTVANTRGRGRQPVPQPRAGRNQNTGQRRDRATSIGSATRYKSVPDTGPPTTEPKSALDPKASKKEIQKLMELRRRKLEAAKRKGDVREVGRLRHLCVWDDITISSDKTVKAHELGAKVQMFGEEEADDAGLSCRISQGHTKELCAFMQQQYRHGVGVPREFVVCEIHGGSCGILAGEVGGLDKVGGRSALRAKSNARTKTNAKGMKGSKGVVTPPLAPPSPIRLSTVDEVQSHGMQQSPSLTSVSDDCGVNVDYDTTLRSSVTSRSSSSSPSSCQSTPSIPLDSGDVDGFSCDDADAGAQQLVLGDGNAKPAIALVDLLGDKGDRRGGFCEWSGGVGDAVDFEVDGGAEEGEEEEEEEEDVWRSLAYEDSKEKEEQGSDDDDADKDGGALSGVDVTSCDANGGVGVDEESKGGINDDEEEEEDLWFALSLSLSTACISTSNTSILNPVLPDDDSGTSGSSSASTSTFDTSSPEIDTSDTNTDSSLVISGHACDPITKTSQLVDGPKGNNNDSEGKGEDYFLRLGQQLLKQERAPFLPKSLRKIMFAEEEEVRRGAGEGGVAGRKSEVGVTVINGLGNNGESEDDMKRIEKCDERVYKMDDKGNVAWWEEWSAVERKARW